MLRAFPRRKVDVVVAPQSAFDCAGCSDLRCLATVTIFQFAPECEGNWAVWTCRHHWAINPAQKCCAHVIPYYVSGGAHSGKIRCSACKFVQNKAIIPFFQGTHLTLLQLLGILFTMLDGNASQSWVEDNFVVSKKSLIQWQVYFCELAPLLNKVLLDIVKPLAVDIQIDETAIGKRKYQRGSRVRIGSVAWVWGAVLIDADGRSLLSHFEYIPKRDNITLTSYIAKTLSPATVSVTSDCWGGTLKAMRVAFPHLTHRTVNHKREFVSSTGVHTNNIESHNKVLKDTLKQRWAHSPSDTYLLDIKVALATYVMNCRPSKVNINAFQNFCEFLFRQLNRVDNDGRDDERANGWDDENFEGADTNPGTIAPAASPDPAAAVAPPAVVAAAPAPAAVAPSAVVVAAAAPTTVVACSTCQGFGNGDRQVLAGENVCRFCKILARAAFPTEVAPPLAPIHNVLQLRRPPPEFSLLVPRRQSRRLRSESPEFGQMK